MAVDKDPQLELKKRARRRLVGAVALAVLAAVVLPMVMDQEPRPLEQDIQIRIPSQDAGAFTSRLVPGKSVEPTPLPTPPEKPIAEKPAVEKPAVEKPAEGAPARDAQVAAAPPEPAPAKAQEKPVEKSPEKQAKTEDKAADEAKLRAILGEGGEFVVQLGVFADKANAQKVQARVKAEGFAATAEPYDGAKTRVRAGPFRSREAAEKARDKLKRAGLNGIVAAKS